MMAWGWRHVWPLFSCLGLLACQPPWPAANASCQPISSGDVPYLQPVWTGRSYAYVLWPHGDSDAPPALIDAGSDPQALALQQALAERGSSLEAVQVVLLTHGHNSHTAGLKRLGHSAIYVAFADGSLARGDGSPGNLLMALAQRMRAPVRLARALRPLLAGEQLQAAGHAIEVIALPGHTDGSVAFAVLGGLVAGDAVWGPSVCRGQLMATSKLFAQRPAIAAKVLERLHGRQFAFIADGHTGLSLP